MESLRWVLLIVGIAVLLAVFMISRYQRQRDDDLALRGDQDPGYDDSEDDVLSEPTHTPVEVEISEDDARSHVL